MTANHILRWISSGAEDEDEDGDEDDEEKDEAGSPEGYEKEENKEEEEDEYDDVAKLELGEGEEEVGLSYLMREEIQVNRPFFHALKINDLRIGLSIINSKVCKNLRYF